MLFKIQNNATFFSVFLYRFRKHIVNPESELYENGLLKQKNMQQQNLKKLHKRLLKQKSKNKLQKKNEEKLQKNEKRLWKIG